MSKSSRKLGMQALESKNLMAGDVALSMYDGDLYIDEYSSDRGEDQAVQVYQLSNGNLRVQGINGTKIATDVNFNGMEYTFRREYVDLDVDGSIMANLGSGDDTFKMLSHNGGVDANRVLVNMQGSGSDSDHVSIYGLSTRSNLEIYTGRGNDHVTVGSSQIGNGSRQDLTINTGGGRDTVSVNTSTSLTIYGSRHSRTNGE